MSLTGPKVFKVFKVFKEERLRARLPSLRSPWPSASLTMWRPEGAAWTLSSRCAAARQGGRLRRANNVQIAKKTQFGRVVGFAHPNPLLPGRKRPCMPLRGIKTGQDIENNPEFLKPCKTMLTKISLISYMQCLGFRAKKGV
jgi:hypothetical protein